MNAKKKIELIDSILERWNEKSCFYCGGALNGDMTDEDYNEMNSDTYCQYCGKDIDPYDEWDNSCLSVIEKVLKNEKFKP
ncbi:MAG: hypothetical protein KGD63_14485 [Candidatus Lokiarchaeota archaeon]|nr:hypothetical protein [Candidatus Lokiarchaeota archaeon]